MNLNLLTRQITQMSKPPLRSGFATGVRGVMCKRAIDDELMKAERMFPLMPKQVFEQYLAPLIQDLGWPFLSLNESPINTAWERVLNGVSLLELHNAQCRMAYW